MSDISSIVLPNGRTYGLKDAAALKASAAAAPFSASINYVPGTFVSKDGLVYKVVSSHFGTWADAHFEQVDSIQAAIESLLQRVAILESQLAGGIRLYNKTTGRTHGLQAVTDENGETNIEIDQTGANTCTLLIADGAVCTDDGNTCTMQIDCVLSDGNTRSLTFGTSASDKKVESLRGLVISDVSAFRVLRLGEYDAKITYSCISMNGSVQEPRSIDTLQTSTLQTAEYYGAVGCIIRLDAVEAYTCLSPDTRILLADGDVAQALLADGDEKCLCDVAVGDAVATPFGPDTVKTVSRGSGCATDVWTFSNGTTVKTIGRHRFWNDELGEPMYLEAWNMGEHAVMPDGSRAALVSHERVEGDAPHMTLFTEKYNLYYANGLLAGNRRSVRGQLPEQKGGAE